MNVLLTNPMLINCMDTKKKNVCYLIVNQTRDELLEFLAAFIAEDRAVWACCVAV
jgi:hypothetical protein